jgi:molecular chaperone DnaK (HSP70)
MLPAKESSKFFTTVANQTSMTINTHKGEDEQASNNPLLGKILISDLPPLPIGEASVTVTFSLNEKGELKVIVLSDKTGNSFEAYYYAASN